MNNFKVYCCSLPYMNPDACKNCLNNATSFGYVNSPTLDSNINTTLITDNISTSNKTLFNIGGDNGKYKICI